MLNIKIYITEISFGGRTNLHVSQDSGLTWKRAETPFIIDNYFSFHQKNKKLILCSGHDNVVYLLISE